MVELLIVTLNATPEGSIEDLGVLVAAAPSYRPDNWAVVLISSIQLVIGVAGVVLGYETAVHLHQSCRKRIVNVFVEWLCYTRWGFSVDCMHAFGGKGD